MPAAALARGGAAMRLQRVPRFRDPRSLRTAAVATALRGLSKGHKPAGAGLGAEPSTQRRLPPRGHLQEAPGTARVRQVHCCSAAAGGAAPAAEAAAGGARGRGLLAWFALEEKGEGLVAPAKLSRVGQQMLDLLKPDWPILAVAFSLLIIASLSELAIPHFVSASIFAAVSQGSPDVFYSNVRLLAALSLSYGAFSAARGACFSVANQRMIRRMREQLFEVVTEQSTSFFDRTSTGSLTSRLGSDCQAVARSIGININVILRNGLQVIGGGIYLFKLSPTLAAGTLGVMCLLWGSTVVYGEYSRRCARVMQDAVADTSRVAEEVISLNRVVRLFASEGREQARYRGKLEAVQSIGARQSAAYGIYVLASNTLYNMVKVVALMIGGGMVLQGQVSGEQLTTFILYVEMVVSSSLSVCDQWGSLMEAAGASERVVGYMDLPPAPQIGPGRVIEGFTGAIELRGVSFSYPKNQAKDTDAGDGAGEEAGAADGAGGDPADAGEGAGGSAVLRGVDLVLKPGELTALVGPSGSGKSTLVGLLERLYDPTEGQVLVDGVDLREVDAAWYRGQLGVVSQNPHLFSADIASNIAYGIDREVPLEEVVAAAKLANAHQFIEGMEGGYQRQVGDSTLSGGQRQRVAIARALVRKPRVLILDEATSALDAESEHLVQEALDRAMAVADKTVLVIAHRLSTVRNADRIVVMNQGSVAETGTHEELMAQRGLYYSLVRRQTQALDGDTLSPHAKEEAVAEGAVGSDVNGPGSHRDGV